MKPTIKILLLEDDLDDVALLTRTISRSDTLVPEIRSTFKFDEFKDLLVSFKPDIILADYNLPRFSGMDALKTVLEINDKIPFVFVTGVIGEELAADTVLSGAWGFILKSNLSKLNEIINECLEKAKVLANPGQVNLLTSVTLQIKRQIEANKKIMEKAQYFLRE